MSTTHKLSPAEVKQRLVRIGKSRRTHHWLLGIIVAIAVFGLLGFFAAPPLIRHVAEQQLGKVLDRPVSIGRIALNPYTLNFEADQVAIAEPGNTGPFISLDKLIVRPSWGSLFRLAPVVNELTIQAPHFHIMRTAPQRFNFSDLVDKFSKPSPQPAGKPFGFSVSNIKVVDGRIDFDDRVLNAQHVIDDWQVGVPFIATLQSKTDIYVQPLLKMRIDGSPLSVTGKTKPFSSTRESDIALQLQGLDVPKLLSYSPTPLPIAVTKGALSSNLDIRFLIEESGPKLTVTGTVDLAGLAVTDHAGTALASAEAIHVVAGSVEPLRRVFHFDEVRLDKAVVNLSRDAQGKLNVLSLPAPPPVAARAAAPASDATAVAAPMPALAVQSVSQPVAQAVAPVPSASVVASASAPASALSASSTSTSASESKDTAAAPPVDFAVAKLSINDAAIHVVDHLPAGGPTRFDATKLDVGVTRFATLSKDPAHYTLTSGFNDGATIKVDGDLWLGASRTSLKLDAKGVALAPQQPYLNAFLAGTLTKGTLDLSAPLDVDWSKVPLALHIGNASVGLDDVQLVAEESKDPVLGIGHALVQIDHVDLGTREAVVSSVELDSLAVKGQRLRDGSIDLMKLQRGSTPAAGSAQAPALQAAAKAVKGAPEQQPWHYRIDTLALHHGEACAACHRAARFHAQGAQRRLQQAVADHDGGHAKPQRNLRCRRPRHAQAPRRRPAPERQAARPGGRRALFRPVPERDRRERACQRKRRPHAVGQWAGHEDGLQGRCCDDRRAHARQDQLAALWRLGHAVVFKTGGEPRREEHQRLGGPRDLCEFLRQRGARQAGETESEGCGRPTGCAGEVDGDRSD